MRPLLISLSLALVACTHWTKRENPILVAATAKDPATATVTIPTNFTDLRAARWHLLRALENEASEQFVSAQQELDRAFRILADLDGPRR